MNEPQINLFSKHILWLANSMGYENQLLYWEPILRRFIEAFPNTQVHTCSTQAKIRETGKEVKASISSVNLNLGFRKISIPSPFKVYKLLKTKPDLIVISEFGVLSFYATLYRILSKNTRLLLLVENDPAFLENFYHIKRRSKFFKLIRSFISKNADLVLCNNRKTRSYLIDQLHTTEEKIVAKCYLTSAIPVEKHSPKCNNKISLLFAGRLQPGKGVHLLLEAVNLLSPEAKNKIKLDIVGGGPELGRLKTKASEYKLRNIFFHGPQPYENLNFFFSNADVFIFPTLGDYRALVGFEALSAGLPIIGSIYDGASNEVIKDGINGFTVDPLNTKDLSEKIGFFVNNINELEKYSISSAKISSNFLPSTAAANLIDAARLCLSQ